MWASIWFVLFIIAAGLWVVALRSKAVDRAKLEQAISDAARDAGAAVDRGVDKLRGKDTPP